MRKSLGLLLLILTSSLKSQGLEISTEHFRIIYELQDEASARVIEAICEDIYQKVASTLDYFPSEKIPTIIRGRTDESNGNFTYTPPSLNLYLASNAHAVDQGDAWLRSLITHELTHYIHLTKPWNWVGTFSSWFGALGPQSMLVPFMPGWFLEGITVYNESELTGGGRRIDPFFEMEVKAPILENRFWNFDQAAYWVRYPKPYRTHYASGYIFIDYLQKTYGEHTFRTIMDSWAAFPYGGLDRPLWDATGKNSEQLWKAMADELVKKFEPHRNLGEGEKVITSGEFSEIQKSADNLWTLHRTPEGLRQIGILSESLNFTPIFFA